MHAGGGGRGTIGGGWGRGTLNLTLRPDVTEIHRILI